MNTTNQNTKNKDLKRRILDISYKYNLSHLGSCFTAVDIIDEIFKVKKPNERFVLSSGHAGLALYVVIEKYLGINAEKIFLHHGVHPDRCKKCMIDCSTGSLGQGLPIAVGMALAHPRQKIYCLISDGESTEGSIWEALDTIDKRGIKNLRIYVNCNQWAAYSTASREHIVDRCLAFQNTNISFPLTKVEQLPFLKGQDAHYYTMTDADYHLGTTIIG